MYECMVLYACLSAVYCKMETQACLPSVGKQPSIILPKSYASMHTVICHRSAASSRPLSDYIPRTRWSPLRSPLLPKLGLVHLSEVHVTVVLRSPKRIHLKVVRNIRSIVVLVEINSS